MARMTDKGMQAWLKWIEKQNIGSHNANFVAIANMAAAFKAGYRAAIRAQLAKKKESPK